MLGDWKTRGDNKATLTDKVEIAPTAEKTKIYWLGVVDVGGDIGMIPCMWDEHLNAPGELRRFDLVQRRRAEENW